MAASVAGGSGIFSVRDEGCWTGAGSCMDGGEGMFAGTAGSRLSGATSGGCGVGALIGAGWLGTLVGAAGSLLSSLRICGARGFGAAIGGGCLRCSGASGKLCDVRGVGSETLPGAIVISVVGAGGGETRGAAGLT